MAGKNYKLTLNKSDGTSQDVSFTIPQGEKGAVGDKGDTGATGDKGATGAKGINGASIFSVAFAADTTVTKAEIEAAGYSDMPIKGDIVINAEKMYIVTVAGADSCTVEFTHASVGPKGDTGATGDKGATGATGDKGATGETGDEGPDCIIVTSASVTEEA